MKCNKCNIDLIQENSLNSDPKEKDIIISTPLVGKIISCFRCPQCKHNLKIIKQGAM